MLAAPIAGQRDPEALADRDGAATRKFDTHHV